jgi:hypothetical protein
MNKPTLQHDEVQSAAWQKIQAYCEERLASCRKQLEGDLAHDQSTKLRGRILELKGILALANPRTEEADRE